MDNADLSWWENIQKLTRPEFEAAYVSGPYRLLYSNEQYSFMGWYRVYDNGRVDTMPFNFNDPVHGPVKLRAKWRLDGGYYVEYNATYYAEEGGTVIAVLGDVQNMYDPADIAHELYADQSLTRVLRAPINTTDGWVFRGWRVVRKTGEGTYTDAQSQTHTYPIWEPIQFDANHNPVYYQPGDEFTIDSALALDRTQTAGVIHLQAYYEREDDSYRRPTITNLILDANDAHNGYLNTDDSSLLPALNGPGRQAINITTEQYQGHPTQILIGDLQSNLDLHLYRYATTDTHNNVTGTQFFTNSNAYFLLGFDEGTDPEFAYSSTHTDGLRSGNPYIPSFPADSVIAVPRDENHTLYAVWEPMVYVTFRNETGGPITIDLSHTGDQYIRVVNEVTGVYDREQATSTVTLAAGAHIKLVLPFGEGQNITAVVHNDHVDKRMSVNGVFGNTDPYGSRHDTKIPYGSDLTYIGTMAIDETGIIVTYTEEPDLQVDYDVNGGVWTPTTNFVHNGGSIYSIDSLHITNNNYRPNDPTRANLAFIGWTEYKDLATTTTDFSSTTAQSFGTGTNPMIITPTAGSSVLDMIRDPANHYLWDFTQPPPYDKILYAIWSDTVTVTFDIVYSQNENDNPVNLHNWVGPTPETTSQAYKFCRTDPQGRYITYSLLKGDKVPMPSDPTVYQEQNTNGWNFFAWLDSANQAGDSFVIDNCRYGYADFSVYNATNAAKYNATIMNHVFDFGEPVASDITLITSWRKSNPQTFTFTVRNDVVNGTSEEEFIYTVKVKDEYAYKGSNRYKVTRDWGEATTTLKNGQTFTVRITVLPIKPSGWSDAAYGVTMDVIDSTGSVIKSNQLLQYDNLSIHYYTTHYQYDLTITQTPKDGFTTVSSVENVSGTISYDYTNGFAFNVREGTKYDPNQENVYPKQNYEQNKAKSLTVVFTNTGAFIPVSPTGVSFRLAPFALLMATGVALMPALLPRRRRKEED